MKFLNRFSFGEIFVGSLILAGAIAFIYAAMISPYDYDWEPAGDQTAVIETIFPYQNVVGARTMNALIRVDDGRSATVILPMKAHLKEGVRISVSVVQDSQDSDRRRYAYAEADLP